MKKILFTTIIASAQFFAAHAQSWNLTGNSIADADFLGTTNSKALVIKVNNQNAGYIGYLNTTKTAFGYQALNVNTGIYNCAFGYQSLNKNTTGQQNVGIGTYALFSNTTGLRNIAIGTNAMYKNKTATDNVAIGIDVLNADSLGNYNTAVGNSSMKYNLTGVLNTGIGKNALFSNTSGSNNTSIGANALTNVTTGSNNTALGYDAEISLSNLNNATAVGSQAIATASNQVMLGSTTITSVKAAGSFVIYSDGRFKKNMQGNVPGLAFINRLKPVTYNYDIHKLNDYIRPSKDVADTDIQPAADKAAEEAIAQKEAKVYTGFVAQEVEKTAEEIGYNFSGVYKPQNEKDAYGLSYADFVVPLVKAVQELSKENDMLKQNNELMQQQINDLRKMILSVSAGNTSESHIDYMNVSAASLEQNTPNPFNSSTVIRYHILANAASAQIIITNAAGSTVKTFALTGKGTGNVTINANELTAGSYYYTLIVDGKKADSKQMILVK